MHEENKEPRKRGRPPADPNGKARKSLSTRISDETEFFIRLEGGKQNKTKGQIVDWMADLVKKWQRIKAEKAEKSSPPPPPPPEIDY